MPAKPNSALAPGSSECEIGVPTANAGLEPRQPDTAKTIASSEATSTILAVIATAFDLNIEALGVTPNGALWKDEEGMALRFEKLAEILDGADPAQPDSVNDFGCGYGALYTFLKAHPLFAEHPHAAIDYAGFDISEKMVQAAQQRIEPSDAVFIRSAMVTRPADYTFVSGTFNFKFEVADNTWNEMVKTNLAELWANTRKGLAFNMLSAAAAERDPDLYYADSSEFMAYCAAFSDDLTLIADYPLDEWTLLVRR